MADNPRIQFPEMANLPENTGDINAASHFDPGVPQQKPMGNLRVFPLNAPIRDNRLQQRQNGMPPNMPAAPAAAPPMNNVPLRMRNQNQLAQSMPQMPTVGNQRLNGGPQNNNKTGGGLDFRDDASRVSMSRMKSSYGEELKKQMEADKRKKRKSKERDLDEDVDFLQESFNYQPFGKGGAGAPLRDQFGNMITSRKPQMRGDHERQHFKRFLNKSSRGSSRASRRSMHRRKNHTTRNDRYDEFEDDDDYGAEPDLIAAGPISNTTAQTAAQMASNRFFKPDYIVNVEPKKQKKAPRMPAMQAPRAAEPQPQPQPQVSYQIVQPQVDWAAWRNELFALLQWERWQREEEEKRRKYQWMNDEEKYKNEREAMERKFQRDLEDRRRQFMDIQQENLERMQDYWEHRHDEEMRRWEEMMAHPRYVQYLDRDNSVKLSQAFVDQLGSTMRLELDKIKGNMDERDLELLKQIASLKKDATVADRERFDSLAEVDRMRGELENQKALDGIRHKYVYNTLLWDKLMDHKMRYPECKPKYKDFDYSKKYAVEKSIVDSIPTVPDGEKFKLDSLDKERIKIDDINQRSNDFLAQTINDKARVELDKLDSDLFKTAGSKTYRDAHDAYSRMGGLKTGEHQVNYKEF